MLSEKEKLDALARLGVDLNLIQDLDILMERILTDARRFVNVDAGSIYVDRGRAPMRVAQPDSQHLHRDSRIRATTLAHQSAT